jgi:hypothetical protein
MRTYVIPEIRYQLRIALVTPVSLPEVQDLADECYYPVASPHRLVVRRVQTDDREPAVIYRTNLA